MHTPSYSQPPFSQPMASPAHQQFAANRQTASPASNPGGPYATPQHMSAHQQSPMSNGQQQQHAMSQQPKHEPPQAQTPVKTVPPSPTSPVAHARNQDRVATLLEINSLLIKEVCELQSQGKAGQVGQTADGKPEGDKQQPSKEYVEYVSPSPHPPFPPSNNAQLHAPTPSQPRVPGAKRRKEPQARASDTAGACHHVRPRRPRRALEAVSETS